jgi:ABC-type phosphate/phosphonate transport system substrate-binding protein
MIASLGMYDMPHLADANATLWAAIKAELGYGPDHLTAAGDLWQIWRAPDLVFAQTCGLPFRSQLFGQVQIVGTPDYAVPGCLPGYYCSVLGGRANGPETLDGYDRPRFALNDTVSQSGWGAPWQKLQAEDRPISAVVVTGAHVNSAMAVARGDADLAAIDAVTWRHMARSHADVVAELRVLDTTAPTAAPPFITGRAQNAMTVRQAIERAVNGMDGGARMTLGLRGVVFLPDSAYLSLSVPPAPGSVIRPETTEEET